MKILLIIRGKSILFLKNNVETERNRGIQMLSNTLGFKNYYNQKNCTQTNSANSISFGHTTNSNDKSDAFQITSFLLGLGAVSMYSVYGMSNVASAAIEHFAPPSQPIDPVQPAYLATPADFQSTQQTAAPYTRQEVQQNKTVQNDLNAIDNQFEKAGFDRVRPEEASKWLKSLGAKAKSAANISTCLYNISLAAELGQPGMGYWGALLSAISLALANEKIIDNQQVSEVLRAGEIGVGPFQEAGVGNILYNEKVPPSGEKRFHDFANPYDTKGLETIITMLAQNEPGALERLEGILQKTAELEDPEAVKELQAIGELLVTDDSAAKQKIQDFVHKHQETPIGKVLRTAKFLYDDQKVVYMNSVGDFIKQIKDKQVPDAINFFVDDNNPRAGEIRANQKYTMAALCGASAVLKGLSFGLAMQGSTPFLVMAAKGSQVAFNTVFLTAMGLSCGSLWAVRKGFTDKGENGVVPTALAAAVPIRALAPICGTASDLGNGLLFLSIAMEYVYFASLQKEGREKLLEMFAKLGKQEKNTAQLDSLAQQNNLFMQLPNSPYLRDAKIMKAPGLLDPPPKRIAELQTLQINDPDPTVKNKLYETLLDFGSVTVKPDLIPQDSPCSLYRLLNGEKDHQYVNPSQIKEILTSVSDGFDQMWGHDMFSTFMSVENSVYKDLYKTTEREKLVQFIKDNLDKPLTPYKDKTSHIQPTIKSLLKEYMEAEDTKTALNKLDTDFALPYDVLLAATDILKSTIVNQAVAKTLNEPS